MSFDLQSYLKDTRDQFISAATQKWPIDTSKDPQTIYKSMEYSFLAPGKRIRPILSFATAEALGLKFDDVLPIATSLEMIHVFSLIHDDLPAMDDDDLRRGQPTNHKVFGDAIAILAGDALLNDAFLPLLDLNYQSFGVDAVFQVIRKVISATGTEGMIGGQVIDMESEGQQIDLERLQKLQRYKTGALLSLIHI